MKGGEFLLSFNALFIEYLLMICRLHKNVVRKLGPSFTDLVTTSLRTALSKEKKESILLLQSLSVVA